ncbi:AzlC family ABC transporter permease [Streptomyces sp. FIT100]|uniref:AzlC family ABC transporter permease n=1 Tax=Streptomyces sp. FIT100 TaxID=2837956 RepID=UPI0021CA1561|nr:AzlC family ABC transporter permease [Streptomyces sp. FIT100]UUN27925.1 AzlC family ABC transporter permease [Streptomyces sp. FIT100]
MPSSTHTIARGGHVQPATDPPPAASVPPPAASVPPAPASVPPASVPPAPVPPGHSGLKQAVRDTGSVGLALFPLGVAFGVLVSHQGLAWWWASVISAFVYAGSLEFLLVGLIVAVAPLAQIAVTAFLVNFRHVFYALSFPLHRVTGATGKAYATFAMTDEAYALSTAPAAASWTKGRILWLQVFCQGYWVLGATAGALVGALLPERLVGLDFALTALFTVLAIDGYKARRDLPAPVLALVCALVARFAFPDQMLLAAMALFTTGLLARRYVHDRKPTRA